MSNDVVLAQPGVANIAMDDELRRMGGLGSENVTAQNVLIPRLVILQALSPQLNKKKAEYIDGAEVGDFCNVATGDVYKVSVNVIPCYFITNYLEWKKGRSGLAMNHGDDPTVLQKTIRNEKNQNILPNGNMVEETAQWYCLLNSGAEWLRIFFPLKSTNLKHSRKWMTLCKSENVTTTSGAMWKPPLFWRIWRLVTIDDSNDQGDWATFKPEKSKTTLEYDPNRELLNMCMGFYQDVKGNVVRGDVESSQDDSNGKNYNAEADDKDIPF